jgi:hypothetical protein
MIDSKVTSCSRLVVRQWLTTPKLSLMVYKLLILNGGEGGIRT